jgi:hypothetical protein
MIDVDVMLMQRHQERVDRESLRSTENRLDDDKKVSNLSERIRESEISETRQSHNERKEFRLKQHL